MNSRRLWAGLLPFMLVGNILIFESIPTGFASTDTNASLPTVDKNGTLHVSEYTLPFSSLASEEAKKRFIESSTTGTPKTSKPPDAEDVSTPEGLSKYILRMRGVVDSAEEKTLRDILAVFPVNVSVAIMGGVHTAILMPRDGVSAENEGRVLINLHGGGMMWGGPYEGQVLSAPIASLGKIKVVTVDYRMAPEYRFPAASEDVAAVYSVLLKHYRPGNIGIYGCSAGGSLTAQALAWFQVHHLPRPGAIAILCSAAGRNLEGDSYYLPTAAWAHDEKFVRARDLYVSQVQPKDPLVWPMYSPAVLEKFPPTAFFNASRDPTMSGAIYSHMQLVKAGVNADLYLWDGLGHAFMYDAGLPESREVYGVVVKFFERHLGISSRAFRPGAAGQ